MCENPEPVRADDVRHLCAQCDDDGIGQSAVTGARGRCRHPHVAYTGHDPEPVIGDTDEANRAFREKLRYWREHGAPAYHGPRAVR
jgi:hypothetical protein